MQKRTLIMGYMLATASLLVLALWFVTSSHQRDSERAMGDAAPPGVNNKRDPSFDVSNAVAAAESPRKTVVTFRGHPMSELALACHSGEIEAAERVLERDPHVLNNEDPNGFTAIIIASAAG